MWTRGSLFPQSPADGQFPVFYKELGSEPFGLFCQLGRFLPPRPRVRSLPSPISVSPSVKQEDSARLTRWVWGIEEPTRISCSSSSLPTALSFKPLWRQQKPRLRKGRCRGPQGIRLGLRGWFQALSYFLWLSICQRTKDYHTRRPATTG